ncbi:MAG: DNA polymerase III subunit gamma/tau [Peptococcaceae bacterium]|nr:DNA polymerase III subunit gamma/tau [Candidatus Syntrophopropionicum ammoniitolerans]
MTYLALYRKWRPQTFGEIIGQEHIIRTLKNAVESSRTGHAYLFCGTRGTGKTTTAKVLAKALNCLERVGPEPCNQCDNCKNITAGLAVDVIEIDAASNRGIDEIRDLREKIKFAPAVTKFRVYIIDEVHMLTNEAFNALLKTLEEPPLHAVLILATTEPYKVPLTILSRCQRFDFKRIEPADIIERLREVAAGAGLEVEEEALRLIARAAEGGLRDALSILDQGAAFGELKITASDVHNILGTVRVDALDIMAGHLASGETGSALRLVSELISEGKDLRFFAREMTGYLRLLLLEKITPGSAIREAWGDPAMITARAADFSMEGLLRGVEILAEVDQGMKWSSQPGIILELALVKACRAGVITSESSLLARLEEAEKKLQMLSNAPPPAGKTMISSKVVQQNDQPGPGGGHTASTSPAQISPGGDSKKKPAQEVQKTYQPGPDDIPLDKGGEKLPREAANSPLDVGIDLKQVMDSWEEVIGRIRQERLPIYYNYVKTQPLALHGNSLVIGFPEGEDLAREMASQPEQKEYLEGLLQRFFQGEWQVSFKHCRGTTKTPEKRPDNGDRILNIKKRFRGVEVVLEEEEGNTLF